MWSSIVERWHGTLFCKIEAGLPSPVGGRRAGDEGAYQGRWSWRTPSPLTPLPLAGEGGGERVELFYRP